MNIPKPILKWIGGKSNMITTIINNFPKEMDNYHEPFVGGGSILFALLYCINGNIIKVKHNVYASDSNEALIYVYKNIQSNYDELYRHLKVIINEFKKNKDKQNYYYHIRKKYNELLDKKSLLASAYFIFLNKTCFRGLHRVNRHGGFNAAYGHYSNPEIINLKHLFEIHLLIQRVIFDVKDFSKSLKEVKDNDFVYLDPPYVSNFDKYTNVGFNNDNHKQLFDICKSLKAKFIMSNSKDDILYYTFKDNKYEIKEITNKSLINSKKPNLLITELLIKSF